MIERPVLLREDDDVLHVLDGAGGRTGRGRQQEHARDEQSGEQDRQGTPAQPRRERSGRTTRGDTRGECF